MSVIIVNYVYWLLGVGNTNNVEVRDDVKQILEKGENISHKALPVEQLGRALRGEAIFTDFSTMLDTLVTLRFTSSTGEQYIHISTEDYLLRYMQLWMAHKLSPWGENLRRAQQWALDCGHFSRWYAQGIEDMRDK